MNGYQIFESLRENGGGGGLLTAVKEGLDPICVETDDDDILVVETKLEDKKCRFINGYGKQENEDENIRKSFFNKLEIEIEKSKLNGSFTCIQLDANAKVGKDIIKNDPAETPTPNGKLLIDMVKRLKILKY